MSEPKETKDPAEAQNPPKKPLTDAEQTLAALGRHSTFTIEIANRLQGKVKLPITQQILRGRFDMSKTGQSFDSEGPDSVLRRMEKMPGMHIHVNTQRRFARVYDPLMDEGNEEMVELRAHHKKIHQQWTGKEHDGVRDDVHEDVGLAELKSWLYWCRRFVDSRLCRVVSGEVPEMKRIMAMPGKIIREDYDSQTPDEDRYRPLRVDGDARGDL